MENEKTENLTEEVADETLEECETVETEDADVKEEQVVSEVDLLKAEVADYKDKWMRNVAEFDNYKKRNATIWKDAFVEGKKDTVLKLLPIGDNIETAIAMINDENTKKGLALLLKQFIETLKNMGIEVIDPTGEEFNPDIAEAVMQVDGEEGESGKVKTTFRKGYKSDNKIIRYAQVSVVR